jgi:hypothetical protein
MRAIGMLTAASTRRLAGPATITASARATPDSRPRSVLAATVNKRRAPHLPDRFGA